MVVTFFELVRDIDSYQICVFNIVHFHKLLVVGACCFASAMIHSRLVLLSAVFDFLTSSIISSFQLLKVAVRGISLPKQLCLIFGMTLPEFIATFLDVLERSGNLSNKVLAEFVMVGRTRFEGSQLRGPRRQRSRFERAWRQTRRIPDAQTARLFGFLFVIPFR